MVQISISRRHLVFLLSAVVALVVAIPLAVSAATSMFADVPDDHIFVDDINWMKTAGVTQGCGDGTTYCPEDDVTRGQMAAFMHRLATGRSVDAGTLDGRDSNDFLMNAEWVETSTTTGDILPGNTVNAIATCPLNKHVVSGGGESNMLQLAMTINRPYDDKTGWTVRWTNTSATTVRPTLKVWTLCAGPGLIALPLP